MYLARPIAAVALTLASWTPVAFATPPKKPPLTGPEKTEVQRIRKKLYPLRKTVESCFFCPDCHNSKAKVIATPSKDVPKGFLEQKEIVCPRCHGAGILPDRSFFASLSQYYQLVSETDDRMKLWLEDSPTLARWVLNQIKEPAIFESIGAHEVGTGTRVVTARLVDFYESHDAKWAVAVAQIVWPSRDSGPAAMLIFPNGMYPFSDMQAISGHARILAVVYKEPQERRWVETSKGELASIQAKYPNLAEVPAVDRAFIESLQRIVLWLDAAGHVATVADCIMEPTRFAPRPQAKPIAKAKPKAATGSTGKPVKALRTGG